MQKGKNRMKVSAHDLEGLVVQVNKILSRIQEDTSALEKRIDVLTKGSALQKDITVGSIRLVEEKKGSDKYRLEAKFKDGVKVADIVFEDRG